MFHPTVLSPSKGHINLKTSRDSPEPLAGAYQLLTDSIYRKNVAVFRHPCSDNLFARQQCSSGRVRQSGSPPGAKVGLLNPTVVHYPNNEGSIAYHFGLR